LNRKKFQLDFFLKILYIVNRQERLLHSKIGKGKMADSKGKRNKAIETRTKDFKMPPIQRERINLRDILENLETAEDENEFECA
jgi:hypothetical protein